MTDLVIIIVNYNTRDYLRGCLESIYAGRGGFSYRVCVVDNASSDGSAQVVRDEFPRAALIESRVNGGFAYANNLGLRASGYTEEGVAPDAPRYALILNPDTKLPKDALSGMIAFMDNTPEAGAAGPKLVLEDGRLDKACRRGFPTPAVSFYRMAGLSRLFPKSRRFGRYNMTFADPDELTEVDSVVGAFMMVRREAIRDAGIFDETFFMYGEDLDWAYRIKEAGWKVFYNPSVTVLHVKRAASRHSPRAQVEFYRAMDVFYRKHYVQTTPLPLHWLISAGISVFSIPARLRLAFSSRGGR